MSYNVISYATSWAMYGRNYQVADMPIDSMRTIVYAFENFDAQGNLIVGDSYADTEKRYTQNGVLPLDNWNDPPKPNQVYGQFGQYQKLKAQGKYFNLCLGLGGWTWSANFSSAVSPANQDNFVKSICAFLAKYRLLDNSYTLFNGIVLDWEYPSNDGVNYGNAGNGTNKADSANFISFLKKLRPALDKLRPAGQTPITISMCCTMVPDKAKFDIKQVASLLSRLEIMTYDAYDYGYPAKNAAGQIVAAGHTNLMPTPYAPWCIKSAVEFYLAQGVPAKKLFIGVAFYSHGYAGCTGIGQPATGPSPDMSWEAGLCDYKSLPRPGATMQFDPVSQGNYTVDPVRKILNTCDGPESVLAKCQFVKKMGLGGILVWSQDADYPITDPRSLTKIMHDQLLK